MARSIALAVYLAATAMAGGLVRRKIYQRAKDGKEDPQRIDERFGKASLERQPGKLIWFHAASVGESLSVQGLISEILNEDPDQCVLITTGTKAAAAILGSRLPKRVAHQYVPVDTPKAVNSFLDHWKPDVAVWTESEFWPRLMVETHKRNIPMLLVNGRITVETRNRWRKLRGMARAMLSRFDLLMVQNDAMEGHFKAIGAPADRLVVTGSLKESAIPLPFDPVARKDVVSQIGRRVVWLAASTHRGEEVKALEAHKSVLRRSPEALLILAPRHPDRSEEVAQLIADSGLSVSQRSLKQRIDASTAVYLADTIGEMGLWYRIAPVSFVGGSLEPIGGHNPFEPAALGSAIIHGPHVENFDDIYARLKSGNAALEVEDEATLADAVYECLHADRSASLAAAAWDVSSEGAGVTNTVMDLMRPYLTADKTAS